MLPASKFDLAGVCMESFKRSKAIISRIYPSLALLALFSFALNVCAQDRARAPGEPRFDRVVIESLDGDAWNGVVFMAKAYQQEISFGLPNLDVAPASSRHGAAKLAALRSN